MIAPFTFVLGMISPILIGFVLSTQITEGKLNSDVDGAKGSWGSMQTWLQNFYTGEGVQEHNKFLGVYTTLYSLFLASYGFMATSGFSPFGLLPSFFGLAILEWTMAYPDLESNPVLECISLIIVAAGLVVSAVGYYLNPLSSFNRMGFSFSAIALVYVIYE